MRSRACIRRAGIGVMLLVAPSALAACQRSRRYETDVEVTRIGTLHKDDAGKTLTIDFEMRYSECPGTQMEVIRGDGAFAACVRKYNVGDKLRASIDHRWMRDGHYGWTVRKVGDCERVLDPNDEAYAVVRECEDWIVNGERVGFQCRYVPDKALVDKCPWFRRR